MSGKQRPRSDEEMEAFWDERDPMDYITEANRVERPRFRPSQAISLRMDPTVLGLVKRIARTKGIGYQTLIKLWIGDAVHREINARVESRSGPAVSVYLDPAILASTTLELPSPRFLEEAVTEEVATVGQGE